MANLTFNEKSALEKLFGMRSGYVLDLSDRSFQLFVGESSGKDILTSEYEHRGTSKANRLRTFWEREPNEVVGMLVADLLEHWRLNKAGTADDDLYNSCRLVANRLNNEAASGISPSAPAAGSREQPPSAIMDTDRHFAKMAIDEARRSVSEDQRSHPKVGAVVVKDGRVLGVAHRGEEVGCHAEFVVLERKLSDASLVGATVYTTLEPCTERNHPKVACARRLVERKVKRVVIGILDPNPVITGKGQLMLRDANIITELFPHDLMAEVEELNRDFIRPHKSAAPRPRTTV